MSQIILDQAVNAYLKMDRCAKYRPAAPSDGFGHVTSGHLDLHKEAHTYAEQWEESENTLEYFIGCGDIQTREALIFTVEAAKNLCCRRTGDHVALALLKMAVNEVETAIKKNKNNPIYQSLGIGR
jgi:hypothetical protein